jgi:large subunit ribosomal protein L11
LLRVIARRPGTSGDFKMARRRIIAVVKIQIPAGQATPAPPVGTALGPHGVAIMEFCKQYNAATESQRGMVVPVEVTVFDDRSFTFVTKTPPTPNLLRAGAGVPKGAKNTGVEKVGRISKAQLEEIARTKMPDLNTKDLDAAKLQVAGTARSMGITIDD